MRFPNATAVNYPITAICTTLCDHLASALDTEALFSVSCFPFPRLGINGVLGSSSPSEGVIGCLDEVIFSKTVEGVRQTVQSVDVRVTVTPGCGDGDGMS
jgi:hypothetical protein